MTEYVYPGATHTRFEHSLGVMDVATRIFDRMAADKGEVLEDVFREAALLRDDTLAKARQALRLAALLHDIGHSCFSHAVEHVVHKDSNHESLSSQLLRSDDFLKKFIDQLFFDGCAEFTANLIKPDAKSAVPQARLLRDIVSGQIDADRTDYLLRDSYHCGVDYGRFDYRRLIECLTVWKNPDSDELEMAIHRDGVHSFESLILARYQMSVQVYYHRLRRIYDHYLREYFKCLDKSDFDTPQKVLDWTDVRAMNELFLASKDRDRPGHVWANRIIDRRHHREVFKLDENAGVPVIKRTLGVLKSIQAEFSDVDFIADLDKKLVSIHKLAKEDDADDSGIDFAMLEGENKVSIGDRSHVLKTLPRTFCVGYIFADVVDRSKRSQIRARCRELRAGQ